jgi:hypothetical protein
LITSHTRGLTSGADVVTTFTDAFITWGTPAGVLTDNGAIFTAKQRGAGRTAPKSPWALGIRFSHRPHHPQTCGKVFQATPFHSDSLSARPVRGSKHVVGIGVHGRLSRAYSHDVEALALELPRASGLGNASLNWAN